MNTSSRRSNAALAGVCAALVAVVLAVPAGATTVTTTVIHFTKESVPAYEAQLKHGEIHALTFHSGTPTGHLHISMNNHNHFTVAYPSSEQGRLVAQAEAAHARVQVATPVKKAAAVKHKLRYIAGAILIVVIIVVLIVLLIGRRRALAEEGEGAGGDGAAP